ncbi:MAG: hypothetical protein K8T25_18380, partial [Planctomycetia bacterium]|nr:hypothetical protein [Planctomycetia bacterium]
PLRESFVAGNDESALAISAVAKPLNEGLRAKGIAWLIRSLNEAVPAEGDCSAESLVRGGICAAAAAELSPESQVTRGAFDRLFGAFLRSHVAGLKDQFHSSAGMRLTPSVQRGLSALLKCMSNADRRQAVHGIAAIVKSATSDGRRSALIFALADSGAVMDEPQAEEVMQAFAPMLEGETNQLSNSGYAVRRFLDARPDREQAKHVVTIARVYLTRTLESNAASGVINTGELGATLGDRLPSQEALTTFQQLLMESAKMGRNGGPFLEAIARRIPAKDQPQAAQSVKKYLQDTDNGLLAVGLVQCLAAMPQSLGPADCPAVVNRVLEIHDHLAAERGRTDFRERNPPRLIASMLDYQLLRMAANVDAPTDPAFVSLLAPSIQQVCTGHPIGVAELMPSIERIRGTMKSGVAPRMFKEATAEGNVRNNKAFVFAGLADRVPQGEKAECFQIAWKWIQTLNSGPPELPNRSRRGNIMDAYDAPAGVAVGRLATALTGSARTSLQQELDAILANKGVSARGVWAAAIASELLIQDAATKTTGLAARIEQLRPLLGENTGRVLYGRILVSLPAPDRTAFLKDVVPPFVKKALPPSVRASDEIAFFMVEVFRASSVVERARFIEALRGQQQLNQSQLINLASIHRISGPLPTREDLADVGNVGIKRMILLVGSEQSGMRWMSTGWDYMNNSTDVRRSGRLR